MKILQTTIMIALLGASLAALYFSLGLRKQRMAMLDHHGQLESTLQDLADHADLELPALRPGFDREPLREVVVTYKNLHGELAFKDKEIQRLQAESQVARADVAAQQKKSQEAAAAQEKKLKEAEAKLKQWEPLNRKLAEASRQNQKLEAEKKSAARQLAQLQEKIKALENEAEATRARAAAIQPVAPPAVTAAPAPAAPPAPPPPPPEDNTALIMSVNAEWGFIVLDAGADKGFKEGHRVRTKGRDGQLVTAVINKVEAALAVADVEQGRVSQAVRGRPVRVGQ